MLGDRKSTPILSLQAESGIPALSANRDYLQMKLYIKFRNVSEGFPTSDIVTTQSGCRDNQFPFNSFSWRAFKTIQRYGVTPIKRVNTSPSCFPPWKSFDTYIVTSFLDTVNINASFSKYIDRCFMNYNILCTYGLKNKESTAAGMYSQMHEICTCWKIRSDHSVNSSELFAIWRALLFVKANKLSNAVIFTDSKVCTTAAVNRC